MKRGMKRGFTLLEMAMGLAAVSLMVGVGLKVAPKTNPDKCYEITRAQMADMRNALDKFAQEKRQFPKPSLNDTDYGKPLYTINDGAGLPVAYIGYFPYATVGLPKKYVNDCFNNKADSVFRYVVSAKLTENNGINNPNQLSLKSAGGGALKGNIAYAIISRGKNGCTGTGTLNCAIDDATIYNYPFNLLAQASATGAANGYFDDLVLYSDSSFQSCSGSVSWNNSNNPANSSVVGAPDATHPCSATIDAAASLKLNESRTITNGSVKNDGSATVSCNPPDATHTSPWLSAIGVCNCKIVNTTINWNNAGNWNSNPGETAPDNRCTALNTTAILVAEDPARVGSTPGNSVPLADSDATPVDIGGGVMAKFTGNLTLKCDTSGNTTAPTHTCTSPCMPQTVTWTDPTTGATCSGTSAETAANTLTTITPTDPTLFSGSVQARCNGQTATLGNLTNPTCVPVCPAGDVTWNDTTTSMGPCKAAAPATPHGVTTGFLINNDPGFTNDNSSRAKFKCVAGAGTARTFELVSGTCKDSYTGRWVAQRCSVPCGGEGVWLGAACMGGNGKCDPATTPVGSACNLGPCPVNGSCGASAYSCATGNPNNANEGSCNGARTWSCDGSHGGTTANCSTPREACPIFREVPANGPHCNGATCLAYTESGDYNIDNTADHMCKVEGMYRVAGSNKAAPHVINCNSCTYSYYNESGDLIGYTTHFDRAADMYSTWCSNKPGLDISYLPTACGMKDPASGGMTKFLGGNPGCYWASSEWPDLRENASAINISGYTVYGSEHCEVDEFGDTYCYTPSYWVPTWQCSNSAGTIDCAADAAHGFTDPPPVVDPGSSP